MRAVLPLLVLIAFAAIPSAARAEAPMCPVGGGDYRYQQRLGPLISPTWHTAMGPTGPTSYSTGGEAGQAVRAVLGAQFTFLWFDTPRQGWSVAFSPGPHDATSARAAIRDQLAARLSAADVNYLDSTLTLLPTPYSLAELEAAMGQITAHLGKPGNVVSTIALGCTLSDGVRVEVRVGPAETPEVRAQVEALVRPLGDKARMQYGFGWITLDTGSGSAGPDPVPTTAPGGQRPTLRVRHYVSLPRTARCIRGTTIKARPTAAGVMRIRLAAGKRSVAAGRGKAARLRLKARRTKVTVTVTLADGTAAIETVTFRRCA